MEKEEWKEGENDQPGAHGQDRRVGSRQQGQRPVDPPQEGHHARAVHRVLQDGEPRLRGAAGLEPQPGGRQHRVHAAPVHPRQGADGPVEPRARLRRQAVRQARLHHGRRRGAAAQLPALRQGRDRLGRPAAEREPRAPAGKPRREGDPRRQHQARAVDAGRPGAPADRGRDRRGQGQVRHLLRRVRRGAQGRPGRGLRQPRPHRQAAALCLQHHRHREREPGRLQGAHEGRPGGHLLHHRRHPGRRQEQPAARDLQEEGHRGAADDGPRGRVGAVAPARVRRHPAAKRGQGLGRPGQAAGRRREEGRRRGRRILQAGARQAQGSAQGQGRGRARHHPPGRFTRLPGGARTAA